MTGIWRLLASCTVYIREISCLSDEGVCVSALPSKGKMKIKTLHLFSILSFFPLSSLNRWRQFYARARVSSHLLAALSPVKQWPLSPSSLAENLIFRLQQYICGLWSSLRRRAGTRCVPSRIYGFCRSSRRRRNTTGVVFTVHTSPELLLTYSILLLLDRKVVTVLFFTISDPYSLLPTRSFQSQFWALVYNILMQAEEAFTSS